MARTLIRLHSLMLIISTVAVSDVMIPAAAQTDLTPDYWLSRAINNLTNDDVEAADKHFRAARDAVGDTAEINLKIGELYIEYAPSEQSKALDYLNTALAKDPALNRARLLLGQTYFQKEAYTEAIGSLTPLLGDTEYDRYARLYLGIIDYRKRRFDMAKLNMEVIVADDDAGTLRQSAESYLDAIGNAQKNWSAYGIVTLRYDSNPQIVSDDAINSTELNTEQIEDYAIIFQGQGSYTLQQYASREIKAHYQLFDIRYDRLAMFEQQGHILRLDATYFGEKTDLLLAYDFEHWSADNNRFRQTQRLSASLTRELTSSSETEFAYQFSYVDRYDDPTRSGPRHTASIHHLLSFAGDWRGGIGYEFELEDTDQVHESESNEFTAVLHAPQFHGISTQLQGSYNRTNFPDAGSSEHRDYEDSRAVSLTVTRKLTDNYHLRLGARNEVHRSDDSLFRYDRYYFDIGLIVSF